MKDKKIFFALLLLSFLFSFFSSFAFSAPLFSPTWGFSLDLPESYEFTGGDGRDNFSFENPDGAKFDIIVYYGTGGRPAPNASLEELVQNVQGRLNNLGDFEFFEYDRKNACLMELHFTIPGEGLMSGWALFFELGVHNNIVGPQAQAMLLAMAYSPAERYESLQIMHFSALDSIAPSSQARLAPGPITEFGYPRENRVRVSVFALGVDAWIFEEDAEAAQALVDREFNVLRRYENSPYWRDAWIRFYRAIYRDSFERLLDIAFQVERRLNLPPLEKRDFAEQALRWVQSFEYERDFEGSDFVNAVSAATEGRGDCDARAMLWAVIIRQAGIPSAIMVSRHYGHSMGLADLGGPGARFPVNGQRLLVAETIASVSIGLIGETVSDIEHWLGVLFE